MSDIQVAAGHYFQKRYLHKERWVNYWYQLEAVFKTEAKTILEVGVGNGIVAETLGKLGYSVETIDIDPALKPTHVASVTSIPVADASFDFVLCAEVLEHLPWDEAVNAMKELHRVTRRHLLVTLPHVGSTFSFLWKIPLIRWQFWNLKIPHFWKTHTFNGQHYWEVGKKGSARNKVADALTAAGFTVKKTRIHPDDPSHVFYYCEKRP